MTLHDVRRLHNHWRREPPLRVLVAAVAHAFGVKFPEAQETKPSAMTESEARLLMAQTEGRIPGVGRM